MLPRISAKSVEEVISSSAERSRLSAQLGAELMELAARSRATIKRSKELLEYVSRLEERAAWR